MPQAQTTEKDLEIVQDLAETSRLIDLDTLDKYEKDVRKTVLLYYADNGLDTEHDVAEELGCTRNTVNNRLNSDEAKHFMKMFSHRDKDELDRWFEELAAKHYNKAMKGLKMAVKRAYSDEDVNPQVLQSCSTALLKADQQFAKNLQEFGAIQKPKERKEVEQTSTEANDVLKRMQDAYRELGKKEEEVESDAEE